jgi:hypothetical protein
VSEPAGLIRCAFCGREELLSPAGLEAMTGHVRRCPQDLLDAAARHNALLLECLTEVLAWLRRPPGGRASEALVATTLEKVLAHVERG